MLSKYRRFCGVVFTYMLGLLPVAYAHAWPIPAATTSASTPYSPVVSFNTLPALQVTTPIPSSTHVPGDFNGDGTSDLLWFNPATSQVGYWTMNAIVSTQLCCSGVTRTGMRSFNVTPGYFVGAVGDFNNDGYADLVFTGANRDLWLWTNDQHGGWISTEIGTYPSQWQLVGAGDIDGDGYDDLLWLDPSECKFGYWTMKGAVRTGFRIIDIACGYYPVSIGYYSPSNRLSIIWTSPANDLYIWDSTGTGFKSYNLTPYVSFYLNFNTAWSIGGGSMGNQMFVEAYGAGTAGYTGANFTRTFDARGNQQSVVRVSFWTGGATATTPATGAYLIQPNATSSTGLYVLDQSNNRVGTSGLQDAEGPTFVTNSNWSFPPGWYLIGAPANKTAAPPWQ